MFSINLLLQIVGKLAEIHKIIDKIYDILFNGDV